MASTSPRSNSSSNRDKTSLVRHLSGQILPDIKDDDKEDVTIVRFESGVIAGRFSSSKTKPEKETTKASGKMTKFQYYARSFAADIAAACTSSFFVALPVAIIDRAVVQNAAGTKPLGIGLREGVMQVFTNPIKAVTRKSYLMVFGVYSVTYSTANCFDSVTLSTFVDPIEKNSSSMKGIDLDEAEEGEDIVEEVKASNAAQFGKFLAVTAANMASSISKDRAFARMYGTVAPSKLPLASWGFWLARDCLTIGAAFSLPRPLAKYLSTSDGKNEPLMSEKRAQFFSQLLPVIAVQVFSTPLHLLANDYYNFKPGTPREVGKDGKLRSGAKTFGERLNFLSSEGPKTFVARIFRIAPAFGFGGVANQMIRTNVRGSLGV